MGIFSSNVSILPLGKALETCGKRHRFSSYKANVTRRWDVCIFPKAVLFVLFCGKGKILMQHCNREKVFHKGSIFSFKVIHPPQMPAFFCFPNIFHIVFHKKNSFGKGCGLAFDFCNNFHNLVVQAMVILNLCFNGLDIAVDRGVIPIQHFSNGRKGQIQHLADHIHRYVSGGPDIFGPSFAQNLLYGYVIFSGGNL